MLTIDPDDASTSSAVVCTPVTMAPTLDAQHDTCKGAASGRCGFPGCPLPEKHAGMHQCNDASFDTRKRCRRVGQNKVTLEPSPPRPLFHLLDLVPELCFSPDPPHGVCWPPDAAARFGNSLCCARGIELTSVPLGELREDLIGRRKVLPWGSARSSVLSRSRKKLIWLDSQHSAEHFMLTGPNAAPRSKLAEELHAAGDGCGESICGFELADELRQIFKVEDPPLAFQPNFAHSDFPMHYDIPGSDGFGRTVVTLNVKESATIIIDEVLDHPESRWRFVLKPGDAWAMRGYARERCTHGVSVGLALTTACKAGCRACRISLNLRCGTHSEEEAQGIERLWIPHGRPLAETQQHGNSIR